MIMNKMLKMNPRYPQSGKNDAILVVGFWGGVLYIDAFVFAMSALWIVCDLHHTPVVVPGCQGLPLRSA